MDGKMKDWIVYKWKDKIDAVEYEWSFQQLFDLQRSGAEILGRPACKTKQDAIEYIEPITA